MKMKRPSVWVGILLLVAGIMGFFYMGVDFFAAMSLVIYPPQVDSDFFRRTFLVDALVLGGLTFLCGCLAVYGVNRLREYAFFGKFKKVMGARNMVFLEDIAKEIPCTVKTLHSRIQQFLRRGYFPEGHLNDNSTCFILTDELYGIYQRTVDEWKRELEKWQRQGFTEEKRAVLQKGEACAECIQNRIDTLKDSTLQQELRSLKESVENLVTVCRRNPGRLSTLRTFLEYYLPLAEKLLKEYECLPDYETGDNLESLRYEIPEGLRTLTEAFGNIGERLCREMEVDIEKDLDLLEALIARQQLEAENNE